MARQAITPYAINRTTQLDRSTIAYTLGVVVDGYTVPNQPGMTIELQNTNGGATARTATVRIRTGGADGQSVSPRTYAVAAGKVVALGPWPQSTYGGDLWVDIDHVELKLAAFQPSAT